MKSRMIAVMLIAAALCSSCAAILEGEKTTVFRHQQEPVPPSEEPPREARGYDELIDAVMSFILAHEEVGRLVVYSYDGDIYKDTKRAADDILLNTPLGAFAVSDIRGTPTKIVS